MWVPKYKTTDWFFDLAMDLPSLFLIASNYCEAVTLNCQFLRYARISSERVGLIAEVTSAAGRKGAIAGVILRSEHLCASCG